MMSLTLDNKDKLELLDVQTLKKHIRVNNKSGIATCLSQLRNDTLRCKIFIKNGGLSILVKLLRNRSSIIVNTTLSILANMCLSSDTRDKLRGSEIGDNVIVILKNHRLESKVHCRACRLVGNLSECSWHAKSLYEAEVIQPLVKILKSRTSCQTYSMAVRALRNIWSSYESSRLKIVKSDAIKLVSKLFITAVGKVEMDAKYTELMNVCLKAMCSFLILQSETIVTCSQQMEGEKGMQGYKCLLRCCANGNEMAIKCLCTLCSISSLRLKLGVLGAAEMLITVIRSGNIKLSKQILCALCLFCQESVHRLKMNNAGGLEVFVMLLKRPELEEHHPMLLNALVHFVYCNYSIMDLVKHGLLEVLVTKLNSITNTTPMPVDKTNDLDLNNVKTTRKRCHKCIPWLTYDRIGEKKYTFPRFDGDSSPGSCASVSSSPPSTPPLLYYDTMIEADIGDDNYSPVYSDTEWGDDDELQNEEADSLKSCKSLTVDSDNTRDSEKADTKVHYDTIVLVLLYNVSLLQEPVDGLADPKMIKSLSAYIKHTTNEKAIAILNRIVRNAVYFMPLLMQGFVFDVQSLPQSSDYLRHLREVAMTGGAIGQLSSMLLRGEEQQKLMIAVSIPFLIVSLCSTLKSLLQNHGGLQLIFRLLNDLNHKLHEQAIWSICRLAITLRAGPEVLGKYPRMKNTQMQDFPRESHSHLSMPMVTFELDDGTSVDACRRTLCQRSDVFFAMLEGSFNESGKRRVRLKNTSRDGLITLLLALNGTTYTHRSIESMLDAVLLADKFLMLDVSEQLTDSSISKLNYKNFCRAWWWSRVNGCHEFRCYCVRRFLTATMTKSQTVRAFRDFSNNEAFGEFLCTVLVVVKDMLCQL